MIFWSKKSRTCMILIYTTLLYCMIKTNFPQNLSIGYRTIFHRFIHIYCEVLRLHRCVLHASQMHLAEMRANITYLGAELYHIHVGIIKVRGFWPQYFLTVRQYWLGIAKRKNVFKMFHQIVIKLYMLSFNRIF